MRRPAIMLRMMAVCLFGMLTVAAPQSAQAAKDELVIGVTQFPSTLNPYIDSMLAKSYVLAMTLRPFTAYDADWRLTCLLCTQLPTIENGLAVPEDLPDGRKGIAVTYTIHPQATWGDGTPVTTKDVVFAWEVGRHPLTGVSDAEPFRRITRIDAKDARTFTIHIDKRAFDYNARYVPDPLPAHLETEPFAVPREYRTRTLYDTDSANPGLYYGPYRIAEVVRGSHIVLERNPTWWGKTPHFRRIVVRVIENTAALEANLLSGSIDYIAGELGLTLDQALALEKRHGGRFRFLYMAGLIYEHIDLNLDNPTLQDRRVREALVRAIDRKTISDKLFAGRQPVAHGFVSPLDWIHARDIPTYDYAPAKAASLLDAAGWSIVEKGIRHNAAGERLTLEIMTTAGNRSRELVQQVLQSQWRAAGIDVRIRNQPARVLFGETITQRKYAAMAMFAWISSPENVPRGTLHSTMVPTPENNFSGQNYTGFSNPAVDELIDAIETELDRDRRRLLWHRLQSLYATALPVIPLYYRANAYVLPKWLKGVQPTGHQFSSTLWVEDWRAE